MTLQDVDRIFRGWRKNPPPRLLLMAIASALGIKMPSNDPKPKYMTADEARVMMSATGGRIDGLAPFMGR